MKKKKCELGGFPSSGWISSNLEWNRAKCGGITVKWYFFRAWERGIFWRLHRVTHICCCCYQPWLLCIMGKTERAASGVQCFATSQITVQQMCFYLPICVFTLFPPQESRKTFVLRISWCFFFLSCYVHHPFSVQYFKNANKNKVWLTCDKPLPLPSVFQLAVYEAVEDEEEEAAVKKFWDSAAHVDINAPHNKCAALKLWPTSGNMRFGMQPGRLETQPVLS